MVAKRRDGEAVNCPRCVRWEERYHALVGELLVMKREGFMPPQATPAAQDLPSLDPKIRNAIREVAGTTGPVARSLETQAWEMVAGGMEPDEVAKRIAMGEEIAL